MHTVPSDFESHKVQTQTQADRLDRESEQKTEAKAQAKAAADRAEKEFAKKEKEAKEKANEAKEKAKKAGHQIKENSDNPVFVGNAVAVVGLSALLGFGAYRKYAANELTWKVVGLWTGVVGLFAAGDYYLSQ